MSIFAISPQRRLATLHERLVSNLNDCVLTGNVPSWLVAGRRTLLLKDPSKGSETSNYRPIACLKSAMENAIKDISTESVQTPGR